MKNFSQNLKKYFSGISFKSPRRRDYKTIGEKAHHDWRYILIFFILATFCAIGLGAFIFVKVGKGEIFSVVNKKEEIRSSISEKRIADVIEQFENRRTHLESLKNSPPKSIDPSI